MNLHRRATFTNAIEDRYRLLVESITDYAIYMLDLDGRVASWNPGAQRFKGYAEAEIIGSHFSRFYTEEDRAAGKPEAALKAAAEAGRFEAEGWRVHKDGGRFWAHVVIDPVRSPNGELLGFAKITRDLTERRITDEALRRSEQQFRLLVEGVTDYALYMLGPTGQVSSWNTGAERIKGYAQHEVLGEHFSRFYTETDRAAGLPARALGIAVAEGRFEGEGERVRKDGSRFWAHVIIDAIFDDQGEVIGFAKITRDITERRETQQALHQAREALFQSQKLDAIGQLTGGVAHDFNNLLMAILGSLELVKKRLPHDPKIMPLIDNAISGAERGAALTQRMLTFARKQALTVEPVDVRTLANGLIGLLERSVGPTVRIETQFASGLGPTLTDRNQLENALLNLTVNARDAMPAGGVIRISGAQETLTAGSGLDLPPGDYVRLSVSDTGEGMDGETLSRALEPFFTTKGVGKGTGLGLSMVHGLAEQSGGRLNIRSRRGQGTTVDLWLPSAQADAARTAASPAPNAAEPTATPPKTILAVDDDPLVLMNTIAMLEDLGHRVLAATSAGDALEALRSERVDLVVTDYAMPQMTGLELAKAIGAHWPHIPVVLVTGYAELASADARALLRLSKPFQQSDLARILREAP